MKNKKIALLLSFLIAASLFINSCKKDAQTSIQTLFTTGSWQLASVQVFHYLGGSLTKTDTLNTTCDSTQLFTFTSNTACTFTNYHCLPQKTSGTWSLSKDQLFLQVVMTVKDTLAGGGTTDQAHPFVNTRIVNLGNYSMILQTGDIGTFYTPTTKRTIVQYGFVRQRISTEH